MGIQLFSVARWPDECLFKFQFIYLNSSFLKHFSDTSQKDLKQQRLKFKTLQVVCFETPKSGMAFEFSNQTLDVFFQVQIPCVLLIQTAGVWLWSKNHSYQGIFATLLLRESQNPPVAGPSTCAKSCEAHHHLIQHSSFRAQRWDLVKGLHRANLSH